MAALIDVADLVVERINDATLSMPITAVRSYGDFDETLAEQEVLRCDVVPAVNGMVPLLARNTIRYRCPISVGVRKKFTQDETDGATGSVLTAQVDELAELLQEISELFHGPRRLGDDAFNAVWQSTEFTANYSRLHLRENRQFLGIVRLTFDAYREVTNV